MHIAIVGAGLSGLATAWFLLSQNTYHPIKITFFDPLGIGGGTSGIAGGLMHPYAGASAKLNQLGLEGYRATHALIELISKRMGQPIVSDPGLLRLAVTDKQKHEFRLSSEAHEQLTWWEAEEVVKNIPALSFHPGIFIRDSVCVNCPLYLEGLWQACEEKGAVLEKSLVESLDDLKNFDLIVLATGAFAKTLLPFEPLSITGLKGQVLHVEWPKDLEPLPFALSSHAYLIMDKEKNICTIGATYERHFKNLLPDLEYASNNIMPKAQAIIPALKDAIILDCKAGVRASAPGPGHMPIVMQVNPKCWVITGMGSKGLLYHALYAEKLANRICAVNNP